MGRAKDLLGTTTKPLRQIAADVGYALSKAFKRIEQRSPRGYRRGRA